MSSLQDRLKIRRENVDTWSTREQLCLASAVLKSGDQNWISVSRSLKPLAEKEALRPSDWFSQKSCAIQYALLLENADTPKRKKRESGETTGESIVKRLTQERTAELGQILAFQRDEYRQLKAEINLLKSSAISDDKLQKMWMAIEQEEREQEQKTKAHGLWLAKRLHKQETLPPQATSVSAPKKSAENSSESQENVESTANADEDKKPIRGQSTLLTSLLKSPSPTTQIQSTISTAQVTSPTIATLLGSNSKILTTTQTTSSVTPQLHQLVSCAMSTGTSERPSAGAPTLSMLLALPANLSKGILPSLPSTTTQNSSIDTSTTSKSTKLLNQNCPTLQDTSGASDIPEADSMVQIIDHIDDVIGKDKISDVIDKDEINEIIGDIEELIKEEITRSPQTTESAPVVIETLPLLPEKSIPHERSEPRNIDAPVSLSNSPVSEVAIEEIDQSTSSIAEIIGTAIEPTESKTDHLITPEDELFVEGKEEETPTEETENKCEDKDTDIPLETPSDTEAAIIIEEKEEEKKIEEEIEVKEIEDIKESTEDQNNDVEMQENKIILDQPVEEDNEKTDSDTLVEASDEINKIVETEVQEKVESKEKDEEPVSTETEIKDEAEETETTEEANETDENSTPEENEEKIEEPIETDEKKIDILVEEAACEDQKMPDLTESIEAPISKKEEEETTSNNENIEEINKEVSDEEKFTPESPVIEEKIEEELKDEVKEVETTTDIKADDEKIEKEKKIEPTKSEPTDSGDIEIPIEKSEDVNDTNSENAEEIKDNDKDKDKDIDKDNDKSIETDNEVKIEEDTPPPSLPKEELIEEKNDSETEITQDNSEVKEEKDEVTEIKEEKSPKPIEVEVKVEEKESEKKKEPEEVEIKKDETVTTEDPDVEEEESSLTKLSGRAMKTYSKKQNVTVDSEPETETSEGADYRAWKKAVLVVYNRLATHKYASVFLRPITEDQAPGYHSVIFRPMDLSTIKKNIDNGTIRSTMHFQRDVMLMFQNAIMYNKHDTFVYKMAMSMQEECLQHMQILVQVTGEGTLRRETRTAASSSNDTSENSVLKRKRSHITPSPHDSDSPRIKKRRKSEND